MADANRIRIFDTTLRDGEQSPGASMNMAEKIEVARALAALGVDIIEAGFPIASQGDFESVRAIATEVAGATVCALARCNDRDIDRAWEALQRDKKRTGDDINLVLLGDDGPYVEARSADEVRAALDTLIR